MRGAGQGGKKRAGSGWAVALLPPFVVLVFYLLRLVLPVPNSAGLSFLLATLAAYWLAPRTRVRVFNLTVGILLAVLLAILLSILLAHRF